MKEIDFHLNQAQRSLDSSYKVFQQSGDYDPYYAGYVEGTVDQLKHTIDFLRTTLNSSVKEDE
jgi:hypothetical protein